MLGIDLGAAWMCVEFGSLSIFALLYTNRYTIRGFIRRVRCHL